MTTLAEDWQAQDDVDPAEVSRRVNKLFWQLCAKPRRVARRERRGEAQQSRLAELAPTFSRSFDPSGVTNDPDMSTDRPVASVASTLGSGNLEYHIAAARGAKRSFASLLDPSQTVQSFVGLERCPQDAPATRVQESKDTLALRTSYVHVHTCAATTDVRVMPPAFKHTGKF